MLRHGFSEMKVTWVNRTILASGQTEVSRSCALASDNTTFKKDFTVLDTNQVPWDYLTA
jgi:hypothetical protein